jgi:epoxyqueuosine reductase
MTLKSKRTKIIKTEAEKFGFISCGISKAEFLEDHASNLEKWLKKNYNGKMSYMERNFDKRLDPRKLVQDSKSVISLSFL